VNVLQHKAGKKIVQVNIPVTFFLEKRFQTTLYIITLFICILLTWKKAVKTSMWAVCTMKALRHKAQSLGPVQTLNISCAESNYIKEGCLIISFVMNLVHDEFDV
jgi:hypothetical protein